MRKLSVAAWALVVFMAAGLLAFLLLPVQDYSPTEKRYLAKPPVLTWDSLLSGEVSQQAEEYITDHFPARNALMGISAYWNLLTGRNTAGSVYHCREGYLIQAPERVATQQLVTNVARFDAFAAQVGLPATLILVPTTGYVMQDVLPAGHAPYEDDAQLDAAAAACTAMGFLDLREVFSEARKETQLFYKTDHHLTSAGCYTVYKAYREALGQTALPQSAYTVSDHPGFHGTGWSSSGYWLTGADTLSVWDAGNDLTVTIHEAGEEDVVTSSPFFLENLASDDMYTTFLDGNHTLVHIQNPNAQGGKLLLVRDSFSHCLAPFLASDYSEIVMVDLRYYRAPVSSLIDTYDITELAFVYGLDNLLTDTNSAWLS